MLRLVFLLLTASFACFGQGIASTQCWGFGGSSCSEYRFYHTYGNISCLCNAVCTNTNLVSAEYEVFWSCPSPYTGSIRGGARSFAVRVEGDLLSELTRLYVGSGFDQQDCNGSRSGNEFFITC